MTGDGDAGLKHDSLDCAFVDMTNDNVNCQGQNDFMTTELVLAAPVPGAISQQLRKAEPLWATVLLVWVGLPGLMLLA